MPRRRAKKTTMEYPDAPAGYVTLYSYKEPYMKFEGGHGYQGVLLFNGETDMVQCHFCGEWFRVLSHHIHKAHGMKAAEYKERVGLMQSTALLSEGMRDNLVRKGLEARLKNLRPGLKKTEEEKDKIRQTCLKNTRERQNGTGTCPEQLLDRLRKLKDELGHSPVIREVAWSNTLVRVFGSYSRALERAGLDSRKPGQNRRWQEIRGKTDEMLLQELRDFNEQYGRSPSYSDAKRRLLSCSSTVWARRFGSLKKARILAGIEPER